MEDVRAAAVVEWRAGERNSPACTFLLELANRLSATEIRGLQKYLLDMIARGAASGDWSALVAEGLHADRFLTLLMALLSSSSSSIAGAAALCMLTSMRVPGAVTHGLMHPLAFFDLTKTLRLLLSTSADGKQGHSRTNKARPAKKGARRRPNARKNADEEEDDEDEEEEPDSSLRSDRRDDSHSLAAPAQLELLSELESFLRTVPLRSYPEVLTQLIEMLALTVSSQPRALAALRCTLREEHGAFESTVQSVLKALLPLLLLSTEAEAKEALSAQHEAVKFVRCLPCYSDRMHRSVPHSPHLRALFLKSPLCFILAAFLTHRSWMPGRLPVRLLWRQHPRRVDLGGELGDIRG